LKQISEMRDYIKLGGKKSKYWKKKKHVTEHLCWIVRLYSSGDEQMSIVHKWRP
jgi:hypothetical protein